MQCSQPDYCRFEQGSASSSLWTFKLEFGIVHTTNCSVCRSYMTHVAVANHSGDASFKDALNIREDRVSTAFLDGLQGGRQIQHEYDGHVLSRCRDERNRAFQDLDAAKKEIAILRDRVLALELAAQDPASERVSKRSNEATSSSTESSAKSDMSSVEHLLFGPSEELDVLSTSFLSTAGDHDPRSIPNLPMAAEKRKGLQTEIPDPAKSLGSSPSIDPLAEATFSTERAPQASALLLKTPSATPEVAKPCPQSLTCGLNLSNSDQPSAIPESAKPSSQPQICALTLSNPSTSHQPFSSIEPPVETKVSTPNVRKSWAQLAKASSSATPKLEKPSPQSSSCMLSSSSTSDQQSSSTVSTSNMPKSWAQLAKASPSAPKAEYPSPQPLRCALSSSNTSDHVEPPGETNVPAAKVPKSWAQLAKASSSITPNPEKPSARSSACTLGPSTLPSSDQQSPSVQTGHIPQSLTTIAHVDALMKAAHSGDDSSLTRIRAFCGTARRTSRTQRTELQRYALLHWRKPSPSVSSPVPSSVTSSELGTVHTTVGDGTFSTEIYVDSSAWGIGFVMDGLWLAWKFSDSLTVPGNSIDNNWAEMLAVEVGLWTVIHWVSSVIQKEGDVIESLEIIVCSDNAGVVKAIEKRHANYTPQQDILSRILDMVSEYDIRLSMKWISSMDNLADGPSRGVPGAAPDLLPSIPALPSYLSDILSMP